jgi:hypothetical protein
MEMTFQNLCAFSRGQNSGHRLQVQARSKKRKKKKRKLQKKNKTCVAAKAHASGRRSPICPGSLVRVGLLLKEKKKASKKKTRPVLSRQPGTGWFVTKRTKNEYVAAAAW